MRTLKLMLLVATTLLGGAAFAQPSQSTSTESAIRDSAATTINWFAANVTLLGKLEVGYRILPHAVVIHGTPEKKQRYMYLHLARPIDLIDPQTSYKSVFHQYDVQVIPGDVDPDALGKLIGERVAISGRFADPDYDPGSPGWEPFPSTILVNAVVKRLGSAK